MLIKIVADMRTASERHLVVECRDTKMTLPKFKAAIEERFPGPKTWRVEPKKATSHKKALRKWVRFVARFSVPLNVRRPVLLEDELAHHPV